MEPYSGKKLQTCENILDWSVYTCLTQLYGGRDLYNLLHKEQLHVSALFIGHLQVDKWKWKGPKHVVFLYIINYTYLYHHIVVLDKYTHSNIVYYEHNGVDEPYDGVKICHL